MDKRVAILLSTYNGGRFLAQQLDSLLTQDYENFLIVARDDGSGDGTRQLLAAFAQQHGAMMHVVEDGRGNLGPAASFSALLDYALANAELLRLKPAYLMFCDQDDIWEPGKLKLQMGRMAQVEALDPAAAVLVHSDLRVVDENNRELAASFLAYQGLESRRNGFANILASNVVTGCTVLINEALARLAMPIPSGAVMHDWWLALVAAAFGRVEFEPHPLVRYRQHGQNTLGARRRQSHTRGPAELIQTAMSAGVNPHLREAGAQAQVFRRRYADRMSPVQRGACALAGLMGSERAVVVPRLVFRLLRAG